jgi:hypothetical protein
VTPHADTGRERRAIQQCPWCLGLDGQHHPRCRTFAKRVTGACPSCGGTLAVCATCHTTFDTQESR